MLSNPKQLQQLPLRLQGAVVAWADEKACWNALQVWGRASEWDGGK